MSEALLGEHFDIHGGGQDLQFPHHENEIAQSEGAHDHPFVNYWMHNGFVRVDNEKMSKSLGNFFTVREILEKFAPEVVRFFILRAHYRSPLNYSDQHLVDARHALTRLYTRSGESRHRHRNRLERAAGEAVQGSDGRRLQHAGSGGRAIRDRERTEPHAVTARRGAAEGARAECSGCCSRIPCISCSGARMSVDGSCASRVDGCSRATCRRLSDGRH